MTDDRWQLASRSVALSEMAIRTNTLVIGASVSGLATAACLARENIEYIIIEKQDRAASPWRHHYDRLHLHTSKRFSNLPLKKFGKDIPKYPSRQQVVNYLDDYQREFDILPVFNTKAVSVGKENGFWITETNHHQYESQNLVMATGPYGKPRPIEFRGAETFRGKIVHSRDYKTGRDFKDQNVLVVGFGNSACEIAIDLYEQGARPSMAVRSPVNVVPRDVLGIPIQELSIFLNRLSPSTADAISAPLIRVLVGDLGKLGLKKMPYGPLEQIHRDGTAPVLDIGMLRLIREEHIKIYGDIDHMDGDRIYFKDGSSGNFDAVVAAIGYTENFSEFLDVEKMRLDDLKLPAAKQKYFGRDGLYFCGYYISPTGQFREIASDAKKIAGEIAKK
jgi:indole-3-pyruvate monooxygenase